jgi:hypothetical protein
VLIDNNQLILFGSSAVERNKTDFYGSRINATYKCDTTNKNHVGCRKLKMGAKYFTMCGS